MANMKTKKIRCIRLFFFVLVLFCVVIIMANEEEKEKKIFTMSECNESSITVNSTGEFSIKIKSNPTTGYSWAVQEIKPNDLVKYLSVKTEEPGEGSQPPKLGAPTYEILTFEALKPGKVEIFLNYRRPWEKDVAPIKTYKVLVTIEF